MDNKNIGGHIMQQTANIVIKSTRNGIKFSGEAKTLTELINARNELNRLIQYNKLQEAKQ